MPHERKPGRSSILTATFTVGINPRRKLALHLNKAISLEYLHPPLTAQNGLVMTDCLAVQVIYALPRPIIGVSSLLDDVYNTILLSKSFCALVEHMDIIFKNHSENPNKCSL